MESYLAIERNILTYVTTRVKIYKVQDNCKKKITYCCDFVYMKYPEQANPLRK